MARPRKPRPVAPTLNPFDAWGDVQSDTRAGRKRLARIVQSDGRRIANYREFCREIGEVSHWLHWELYDHRRLDPKAIHAELRDINAALDAALAALAGIGPDPIASGQGFLARFLLTEPPSAIGTRLRVGHAPASEAALAAFTARVAALLRHPLPLADRCPARTG